MRFNVSFKEGNTRLDAKFSQSDQSFLADFASLQKMTEYQDADPYTGSYEVTPKVDAQTLPTAQKLMTDNVQIHAIPIFEVSNTNGGETVYIASEVEFYGD